jgi:hypothetical protein
MPYYDFIWNDEPGGNREHIAEHGLTPDEVEEVFIIRLVMILAGHLVYRSFLDLPRMVGIFWLYTNKSMT